MVTTLDKGCYDRRQHGDMECWEQKEEVKAFSWVSLGSLSWESGRETRTGKRKRSQAVKERRGRTFRCREQRVQGLRDARTSAVKRIAVCLHQRVWWGNCKRCLDMHYSDCEKCQFSGNWGLAQEILRIYQRVKSIIDIKGHWQINRRITAMGTWR